MSDNIVPIADWGKHLLEELLFRAAERVGARCVGCGFGRSDADVPASHRTSQPTASRSACPVSSSLR